MSSQQLIKALSQQSTQSCSVGVTSCGGNCERGDLMNGKKLMLWSSSALASQHLWRNWHWHRRLKEKKKTDTWWASQTKKPTLWSSSPAYELSRRSYEHHVTGETDTTIIMWEEETDITIIIWEEEADTIMVVSNFQRLNAELRKRDLNTATSCIKNCHY